MAALLRKGLDEEGCSVIVAPDGEQGLEAARSCDLDAIVLDVMLPKLNGLEVVRRLRQARNQTPVLMQIGRAHV